MNFELMDGWKNGWVSVHLLQPKQNITEILINIKKDIMKL